MSTQSLLEPRPAAADRLDPDRAGSLRRRLSTPSVFLFVILTSQLMVVLDSVITL
jgi:hypothetical protein